MFDHPRSGASPSVHLTFFEKLKENIVWHLRICAGRWNFGMKNLIDLARWSRWRIDGIVDILAQRFLCHWHVISYETFSMLIQQPWSVEKKRKSILLYLMMVRFNNCSLTCIIYLSPFCKSPTPFSSFILCRAQSMVLIPVAARPCEALVLAMLIALWDEQVLRC